VATDNSFGNSSTIDVDSIQNQQLQKKKKNTLP